MSPLVTTGYRDRRLSRRRIAALVLTLLAHALIVLLLLTLGPPPFIVLPNDTRPLTTFDVRANATPRTQRKASAAKAARVRERPTPRRDQPAPTPVDVTPVPQPVPMPYLLGGKELFEAADISKMPRHAEDAGSGASDGKGAGQDSAAADGPGEGPGGQRLYNAEWYREPTHAEMATYMPKTGAPQGGWAMIACRTVPNYRVEDCRELGEGPMGSGLSRALRQASWQFRVLPPRIGGKQVIGAWVRIRFDFTLTGTK